MLQIVRNRTWAFDLTIFDTYVKDGDPGNVPTNHTGWTIRSQIRTRVGNKLVANLNVTFPVPASGTVAIRHERDFTRSLATGDYWWDIVATDPAGDDHVYVEPEPIAVRDNPTDPANSTYDFVPGGGGAVMHTHVIADVTGLQAALNGKAPLVHTHSIANVTGLQAVLDGKAPLAHTHVIADVLGLQTILNDLSEGGGGSTTYAGLTDAATVDLPTVNTPLASALSGKAATSHTHVSADVSDATSAATANKLVIRDGSGSAVFFELYSSDAFIGDLNVSGGIQADGPVIAEAAVTFQATSSITFDSTTYTYGTGAASAHRIALGAGTTGAALFGAADAAAARTTLMGEILKYDPNAAATRTNPAAYADDDTLVGINLTVGMWEISWYAAFDTGCGVNGRLLLGTSANVDILNTGLFGVGFRGTVQTNVAYASATGELSLGNTPGALGNWALTGNVIIKITGNTTLALQYFRNSSVGGATITRRAGAFLRARKIN